VKVYPNDRLLLSKEGIKMEIIIVRHAEPNYEIDSLTDKGWKEARLLSEKLSKLNIDEFYCSPQGRAKDTASITMQKVKKDLVICDWLREFKGHVKYDFLDTPIRCWDMLPSHWTNQKEYFTDDKWHTTELMQTGNVKSEYDWVVSELDVFLAKHGYVHEGKAFKVVKGNHDRIVFFCHYGVSCVILAHLLGFSPVVFWQGFVMQPSSVTSVVTEEREEGIAVFRVRSYGDISHLYVADEEPSFMARFCECYSDDERHDF